MKKKIKRSEANSVTEKQVEIEDYSNFTWLSNNTSLKYLKTLVAVTSFTKIPKQALIQINIG